MISELALKIVLQKESGYFMRVKQSQFVKGIQYGIDIARRKVEEAPVYRFAQSDVVKQAIQRRRREASR